MDLLLRRRRRRLQLLICFIVTAVGALTPPESTLIVRFHRAPPARSRFSTAVFRYSAERPDGSNACRNNRCSIYCEVCRLSAGFPFFFLFPFTSARNCREIRICSRFISIPHSISVVSSLWFRNIPQFFLADPMRKLNLGSLMAEC